MPPEESKSPHAAGRGRHPAAIVAIAALALAGPPGAPLLPERPGAAFAASATVAVTPLEVVSGLAPLGPRTEALARALEAELARLGHRVILPAETGPVWEAVLDSVGGLYDTSTGELDDAKEAAARRALAARAAARFGATVVLRPSLEIAEAEWRGGKAEWDGAEEGVGGKAGGGIVPALTLAVEVLEADGTVRCRDRGGIQVLVKYGFTGGAKEVKAEKLLQDADRLSRAVTLAIECFTGGGRDGR